VKSRRAAEMVTTSRAHFLEGALKLKVNQDKSQVDSSPRLKFLGFSMWKIKEKSGISIHGRS
jgi:hypothetical protein